DGKENPPLPRPPRTRPGQIPKSIRLPDCLRPGLPPRIQCPLLLRHVVLPLQEAQLAPRRRPPGLHFRVLLLVPGRDPRPDPTRRRGEPLLPHRRRELLPLRLQFTEGSNRRRPRRLDGEDDPAQPARPTWHLVVAPVRHIIGRLSVRPEQIPVHVRGARRLPPGPLPLLL
ncbi:unnamed protein product, partial [Linum tenue]